MIQKPLQYNREWCQTLSGDTVRAQALSGAPHVMKNVKLISGALLVPDKVPNTPHLKLLWLRVVPWPSGQPERYAYKRGKGSRCSAQAGRTQSRK